MFKRHQNPQYVLARIRQFANQFRSPAAPWLVPQAVEILDHIIRRRDICMEFGSGRSTKWLAARCAKLTSVEHNPEWFHAVSEQIKKEKNIDLQLRHLAPDNPENSEYVMVLRWATNDSLDLILNDGKYRDYIALFGIDKLRAGGVMVIDNAERYLPNKFPVPESQWQDAEEMSSTWAKFYEAVQEWRRIWVSDGVSTTLIIFKP